MTLLWLQLRQHFLRRIFIDHLVLIGLLEKGVGKGLLCVYSFLGVDPEHFFHEVHGLVRNLVVNALLEVELTGSILFD